MGGYLTPVVRQRFFDTNGEPLSFGKVYTYVAGSNGAVSKATYTDYSQSTANTNPVELDIDGYADIWLSQSGGYLFIVKDEDDNLLFSVDDVIAPVGELLTTISADDGASAIGWKQLGVDAIARTVESKLRDTLSVVDFGTVGQRRIGSFLDIDDAPAFNRAAAAALAHGVNKILIPAGCYNLKSQVVWELPITWEGEGFIEGGSFSSPANPAGTAVGFTEPLSGTCLLVNNVGYSTFEATGAVAGDIRGTRFKDILVCQDHPIPSLTPGVPWVPTTYDYVFNFDTTNGGIIWDNVFFHGIYDGIKGITGGRYEFGVKGQTFHNFIFMDNMQDLCWIHNFQHWPFWSGNVNVLTWTQANGSGVKLGRIDGIRIGSIFTICLLTGLSMQNFNGYGTPLNCHIDFGYFDLCKYGIRVVNENTGAPGFAIRSTEVDVDHLTTQCENVSAGDGSAIPGSVGVYYVASVDYPNTANVISIRQLKQERHIWGVRFLVHMIVSIDTWYAFSNPDSVALWDALDTGQIRLGSRQFTEVGAVSGDETKLDRALRAFDSPLNGPFASDAAAAAGGVALGMIYRKTGGTVAWRQV